MAKRILIIEDEGSVTALVRRNLSQKGYDISVRGHKEAFKRLRKDKPSLVILDLSSSQASLSETCQRLRSATAAPIIALTDSPRKRRGIEGVEYLAKPLDFKKLVATVESTLSHGRKRRKRSTRYVRRGDLVLDLKTRYLTKGERRHHLTPKETSLLKLFMRNSGRVLSHKRIMKEVWDTDYLGDTRTLYVHVSWIRKKIEGVPGTPAYLRTVRGVGYRFDVK